MQLAARPRLREALAKPLAGDDLTGAEALALLEASELLPALLETAAAQRDRTWGRIVTYSPKVFLPVTNLCRDRCTYCTFRKDPGDPDAWTMSPEEIHVWATRGRALGCMEALMCLGDKPEIAYRSHRDWLAAKSIDDLVTASGGLYVPPAKFLPTTVPHVEHRRQR